MGVAAKKILILKFSALGDVILMLPMLQSIRDKYPTAHITFLVADSYAPLLQVIDVIDELITIPEALVKEWHVLKLYKFSRTLDKYDLLIDLQNNRRSHLLGLFSRIQNRVGFNCSWGWMLTSASAVPDRNMKPIARLYAILYKLDISMPNTFAAVLSVTQDVKAKALRLIGDNNKKIIGINLSASPRWQSKCWELVNIIELTQMASNAGYLVVLNGTSEQSENAAKIVNAVDGHIVNLVDKTNLPTLLGVIDCCDVFISPDTGPLHMAAALGVPSIGLFGPTSLARHAPVAANSISLSINSSCSPCYKQVCPLGTHECMQNLSSSKVFKVVESLLS